jgi:hypothetical protein
VVKVFDCCSTLAASAQIIFFLEVPKILKNVFLNETFLLVQEILKYFEIFCYSRMKSSKLRSLKLHEIAVVQITLGFCFCSYLRLGCSQI